MMLQNSKSEAPTSGTLKDHQTKKIGLQNLKCTRTISPGTKVFILFKFRHAEMGCSVYRRNFMRWFFYQDTHILKMI